MQKLRIIETTWQDPAGNGDLDGGESALYPFPEGWYFVADRRSIMEQTLLQRQWLGQDIVAWCDNEGTICVARSVCPHLGSSLSPEVGARVRDGHLVCPFHGFTYNTDGACVATPYAEPPKSARLNVFETREICGLVFAWWGIEGRPPQWDLPEEPADDGDWSGMEMRTLRFPGHPQETTENSVDLAHLRYVHGYDSVGAVGAVTVDGPHLVSRFDFRRRYGIIGFTSIMEFSVTAHVYGLGYSNVDIHENRIGIVSRMWVLATPVDGTFIDLVLVGQLRNIRKPKRLAFGLAFLPVRLRTRLMGKLFMFMQVRDVLQDVKIWGKKTYRTHPRLCRADGAIGKYRRYCRQFYPDALHADRDYDQKRAGTHQSGAPG